MPHHTPAGCVLAPDLGHTYRTLATPILAGAFGCTISGAGPTAVAIVDSEAVGERVGHSVVSNQMQSGAIVI